jgi:hypothetical protein
VARPHDFTGTRRYDTVMAWEAACYFDRPRWFIHLRTLLVPGGRASRSSDSIIHCGKSTLTRRWTPRWHQTSEDGVRRA